MFGSSLQRAIENMVVQYPRGGRYYLLNLLKLSGSVFPSSFCVAFPCAILAGACRYFVDTTTMLQTLWGDRESILSDAQAFSGFTFLVGFLVVFRTSQAYSSFFSEEIAVKCQSPR